MIEGFWLMAVGMSTVFGFLTVMVALMYISAAFFETYGHLFPEPDPVQQRIAAATSDNDAEIAVVLAAIALHRSQG